MRQINNVTDLRTYGNTAFGVSIHYPASWRAGEPRSNPLDNKSLDSPVAIFTAPLENANATDTSGEKALLSIQLFRQRFGTEYDSGKIFKRIVQRQQKSIGLVIILGSNTTTFAGQPAHRKCAESTA